MSRLIVMGCLAVFVVGCGSDQATPPRDDPAENQKAEAAAKAEGDRENASRKPAVPAKKQ